MYTKALIINKEYSLFDSIQRSRSVFIKLFVLLLLLFSTNLVAFSQKMNTKTIPIFNDNQYDEFAYNDLKEVLNFAGISIIQSNMPLTIGINIQKDNSIPEYGFFIDADNNRIILKYSDEYGYQNAIYYLLHKWGVDYLGVSDNWINYSKDIDFFEEKNLYIPDINLRYFGTGGWGHFKKQENLIKDYQRRNSLNIDTGIGHGYNDFYKLYKKKIDYYHSKGIVIFNDYDGKKSDINENSKEAMNLVKEYFERQYLQGNLNLRISPKDGVNISKPNSSNSRIINNISKWLWIGNEVAKYLNTKYPNNEIQFGYYAYGNGKGQLIPPNFPLEKNIAIEIIPYAFQRDFKDDLLNTKDEKAYLSWNTSHPNLTYYTHDYWNINPWSQMLPQEDFFNTIKKIDTWKNNKIKGVNIESTYNSALTNPHFWVASQYAKGFQNISIEELYNQYFELAFKDVSSEMYEFYTILSHWKGPLSLCTANKILNSAYNTTNDQQVKNRIIELMAYMHFAELSYTALNNKTYETAKNYELWAKKVNSLGIIQTHAAWGYDYGKNKIKRRVTSINEGLSNKDFKDLKTDIIKHFLSDLQECNIDFQFHHIDYDLSEFVVVGNGSYTHSKYTKDEKIKFVPSKNDSLSFELTNSIGTVELKSDSSYMTFESPKKVKVYVKKGTEYTLWLNDYDKFKLNNSELLFFYDETSASNSYSRNTFYFYVPENIERVIFQGLEIKEKNYFTDILDNNTILPKQKLFDNGRYPIYSVDLKNYKGKILKIRSWSTVNFEILNFNALLSRQKFKKRNDN